VGAAAEQGSVALALAFALDAALDWLIGGKNAPPGELAWAAETILAGIESPARWRAGDVHG
jgi:hypothetical protein